jgi:hypothetical protein
MLIKSFLVEAGVQPVSDKKKSSLQPAAERRMPFFIQPARKPCSNATGTDEFKVCSQVFWLSRLAAAFPNQKISSVA